MDSWLRERFARLGPIRGIDRVSSGSPAVFVLRLPEGSPMPRTIDATFALARRGPTMLRAKRAIEALVETGQVIIDLPMVESIEALTSDLERAGVLASLAEPVRVRATEQL